jgi:rhamnose utilization protein RhaD (predicted bifunctional aldolase and dehydrogenase)
VGKDSALVQGAGGNSSFKSYDDDTLWVKASGKWLADALEENIFVALRLSGIRQLMDENAVDPVTSMLLDVNAGLRPSIETTLHAILPHKVVLHVHSVAALSWLVRVDAESQLETLLTGMKWTFVPYAKPGATLTKIVQAACKHNPDILLLGNHGLVIAGDSFQEAEDLLNQVETRLFVSKRIVADPVLMSLERISKGSEFRPAKLRLTHAVALDPHAYAMASKGTLYPDHVVFLGPSVFGLDIAMQNIALDDLSIGNHRIILVEGKGVLIHDSVSRGGEEMALCLSDVLLGTDEKADIRYLSVDEEDELLNWDAEKYRQTLNS